MSPFVPIIETKAEPIRLRTVRQLRWVAILGQLIAVAVAWQIGVRFYIIPVIVAIIVAAALNLWLTLRVERASSSTEATLQLAFDLIQIGTLVGLTGGLTNPFALLILAPVTIAASALPTRGTKVLCALAIAMIASFEFWAPQLFLTNGSVLQAPAVLRLGHGIALMIGVVFFATYARRVAHEFNATSNALFATQMALGREQQLQHLGGVVAAAAHELGTPLATIKLIASELRIETEASFEERPELRDDLDQLVGSVDRCAEILREMGRAGKDDLIIRTVPIELLLEEAAEPHASRGVSVHIRTDSSGETPIPDIRKDPGIVHGLRNIIQNAVDYAESWVLIEGVWDDTSITITISDDGPGFPTAMLSMIGEPLLPARSRNKKRTESEGMGLGLFIAKTLLERSGARLKVGNSAQGASVSIQWPRDKIVAGTRTALPQNELIRL